MKPRTFLICIALIALIVGGNGLFGTISIPSKLGAKTISCGTAASPNAGEADSAELSDEFKNLFRGLPESYDKTDYVAQCGDAVSERRLWAWPVTVAGGVVLAWALFVMSGPGLPRVQPETSV